MDGSRSFESVMAGAALAASLVFAGPAAAQDAIVDNALCQAPTAFCGRTLSPECVSRLGAGAVAVDETRCRDEAAAYRDCLSLVAAQCADQAAPQPTAPPQPVDADAMLAIWDEVKDSGDPDALDAFADAYASSPLAALARNRSRALRASIGATEAPLAPTEPSVLGAGRAQEDADQPELGSGGDPAATADAPPPQRQADAPDPALAAERARAQEAQRLLNRAGYAAGPVDGRWGPRSADALAAFARAVDLPADGVLTDAHLAALRAAPPAKPGAGDDQAQPPARDDGAATATIQFELHRVAMGRRTCVAEAALDPDGGLTLNDMTIEACGGRLTAELSVAPDGRLIGGRVVYDGIYIADLNGTRWRFSGLTKWRQQRGDVNRIVAEVLF